MNNEPIKYVLTGGPCTGKTTTINHLKNMGYQTIQEAASILIAEEILQKQIEFENKINPEKIAFVDRSIIDTIAYCKIFNSKPPESFIDLAKTHTYTNVFILDFLNTYVTNNIRLENKRIAKKIHNTLINTYQEFGYNPIFIPALELSDRVNFILSKVYVEKTIDFQKNSYQQNLHI